MSTPNVSITMKPEEMVKIIKEREDAFYAQDCIKQKYQDYFEELFDEAKQELLQEGVQLRSEDEIQRSKDLFVRYYFLEIKISSIESKAKVFDIFLSNTWGLSDEEIEEKINYILTDEHLMDEVNHFIENSEFRDIMKQISKLSVLTKSNE